MVQTLNLGEIKDETRDRVKRQSLAASRITQWANIAQDRIFRAMDLDSAEVTRTFTTVSGNRAYYIECAHNKIKSLVNETHQNYLSETTEQEIDRLDPAHSYTGTPATYAVTGVYEVTSQPSSAGTVSIVSSSASDTSQTARVRGKLSGVDVSENLTLNGTTTVTSTQTFDEVHSVRLSTVAAGIITATENAGSTTLVQIPVNKLFMQYQQITLYPEPSAADTMRITTIRGPRQMVEDDDIPDLPEAWHDVVLEFTIMLAHEDVYAFDLAAEQEARIYKMISQLEKQQGKSCNNSRKVKTKRRSLLRGFGRYPTHITGD